jgi:hypothetical protein
VHQVAANKVANLRTSLNNVAVNTQVMNYFSGADTTQRSIDEMHALLNFVQRTFEVEFVSLLFANTTLAFSPNAGAPIGQAFNPGGLVTLAAQDPLQTMWMSVRMPYAAFAAERPPKFRDRFNALDMAFKVRAQVSALQQQPGDAHTLGTLARPPPAQRQCDNIV